MNGNIIKFEGKSSNKGQYNILKQQILTLRNIHKLYTSHLEKLIEEQLHKQNDDESFETDVSEQIKFLKIQLDIIDRQITKMLDIIDNLN